MAGAHLSGSALGFVRPGSDVDLGLIAGAGSASESELDVAGRVEARLGRLAPPFHVNVLRPEENTFTFSVLRDGELSDVAGEQRVAERIETVGRQPDDLEPFRRTFHGPLGMRP